MPRRPAKPEYVFGAANPLAATSSSRPNPQQRGGDRGRPAVNTSFLTPSSSSRPSPHSNAPSPAASIASRSTASLRTNNQPYGATPAANSTTSLMPPGSGLSSAASSTASLVPQQSQAQQRLRPQQTVGNQPRAALSAPPLSTVSQASDRPSTAPSISDKFSLSPDPSMWGANLSMDDREPDDYLHNPDPKRDRKNDRGGTFFTPRGIANLGCLLILAVGMVVLFAGYPIIYTFTLNSPSTQGGFNLGGINASGQVPQLIGDFGLIDPKTPSTAQTHTGLADGSTFQLVFSDEFETDGRSFYPGDDPYWEAVNLHYWETNNLEWYDPSSITTEGGSLKIWLNNTPNHDLNYMGGMVSSWNKFCFTGGYIEVSVSLPGLSTVWGLWPAVWTMGNLGRAGYGASLDGMWPYSYDSCDVGTLPNQTLNDAPAAALTTGDPDWNGALSFLPGQRLSACTCPGEDHPGPINGGTYVGRSAPEIDILEAQVDQTQRIGGVSQSGQWAPFNAYWEYTNTSAADFEIYNPEVTLANSYLGGVYQQATSSVTNTNQQCYTGETGCFATYGFEYEPGLNGYITWVTNGVPAWTIYAAAVGADPNTEISARPIPEEPMYIIANLGISQNFGAIDFAELVFPVWMLIDYVRVYQKSGQTYGCDPPDHPTEAYINSHLEAYSNCNLTTFDDYASQYGATWPKNRLVDTC